MPDAEGRLTIADLAKEIWKLWELVGYIATDHAVLDRTNAPKLLAELARPPLRDNGELVEPPPEALEPELNRTTIDLPEGRTEGLRISELRRPGFHARKLSDEEREQVEASMKVVLDFEIPVIVPRWAFDQVIGPWLGKMDLSASFVLSIQRTILVIDGELMVRVGKMLSDPRSQMVSLRPQTVRALGDETVGGIMGIPRVRTPPISSTD